VFLATRECEGERTARQGMLFPDMPVAQWRDVVQATTRVLYQ